MYENTHTKRNTVVIVLLAVMAAFAMIAVQSYVLGGGQPANSFADGSCTAVAVKTGTSTRVLDADGSDVWRSLSNIGSNPVFCDWFGAQVTTSTGQRINANGGSVWFDDAGISLDDFNCRAETATSTVVACSK